MAGADGCDRLGVESLFSTLYEELSRLAQRELAIRRGADETIGPGSLLHETYMVICERNGARFSDHGCFMAYAARVMRGLIIDHARSRSAQKRGGKFLITSLDEVASSASDGELEVISDALAELTPPLAEIVDLKFFCGFSFAEIAAMQGVSERTVQRTWDKARFHLRHAMRAHSPD